MAFGVFGDYLGSWKELVGWIQCLEWEIRVTRGRGLLVTLHKTEMI